MLIISFDAVGDDELDRLSSYPAVGKFLKESAVFRGVPSLFVSNTYPIHTSVATGLNPKEHGVVSNTVPEPAENPVWVSEERNIQKRTVWQAAKENGIDTAAVLWPVTVKSKSIRWNIPEVQARPGKNQIITSLRAGSAVLQLKLFLRHKKLFKGTEQPHLDNFATACMTDILKEHKPGLAMIHLTAFDALCHKYGKGSAELEAARESLDKNLSALLSAAVEQDVLVFSDHSQINVRSVIVINRYLKPEWGFAECCGGSAFFHSCDRSADSINSARAVIENSLGFRRFLTEDEMEISGYSRAAFGFCAQAGFCYEAYAKEIKANHGYPPDMPNYRVFYMARGFGLAPGEYGGGSLLNIAPLILKGLNIKPAQ